MGKIEEQQISWRERKQTIKHKWLRPLIFVEWLCERLSYLLGRWAFLEILGHVGRFSILASVVVGVGVYWWEADERRMQAENQRKAKHYQAWQVINAAQGKRSSEGRIDALQDLNMDKVSLRGVDVSNAYLSEIDLKDADLEDANLSGAILVAANLSRANIRGANLSGANLYEANLLNIRKQKDVKSIELANIYGIKNPPEGFIEWAKEHGAAAIKDLRKWEALLVEKRGKKKK